MTGVGRGETSTVTAGKIVIATGTRPALPGQFEFDDRHVLDSDAILKLKNVADSMVVVGAGVIGIEYASMFATRDAGDRGREAQPDAGVLRPRDGRVAEVPSPRASGHLPVRVEVSDRGTVTSLWPAASGSRPRW
jgi:NAD(P) transhydrogenase